MSRAYFDKVRAQTAFEATADGGVSFSNLRKTLSTALSLFVRADGSDSNTGLANTSGGAWLTIQHAFDQIVLLDLGNVNVNLTIGAGTFNGAALNGPLPANKGRLTITMAGSGAGGTYLNHVPTNQGSGCLCFGGGLSNRLAILLYGGCQTNSGPGSTYSAIVARYGAYVSSVGAFSMIVNGGNYSNFIYSYGANVNIRGTSFVTLKGNFYRGVQATTRGYVNFRSTLTVSATPKFYYAFANADGWSEIHANFHSGSTLSGATGPRYKAFSWSNIFTNGAGSTYLPGNAAGTIDAFSTYN